MDIFAVDLHSAPVRNCTGRLFLSLRYSGKQFGFLNRLMWVNNYGFVYDVPAISKARTENLTALYYLVMSGASIHSLPSISLVHLSRAHFVRMRCMTQHAALLTSDIFLVCWCVYVRVCVCYHTRIIISPASSETCFLHPSETNRRCNSSSCDFCCYKTLPMTTLAVASNVDN